MNLRGRILEVAGEQFFLLGFRRVTMDEIASRLGISKRTLYEHFPSKKELLRSVLRERVEQMAAAMAAIIQDPQVPVLEKLQMVLQLILEKMPQPSPYLLEDLQRGASDVWEELDQRRRQVLEQQFGILFRSGREGGLLRHDLEADFLLLVFLTLVTQIINPRVLMHFPLTAAQAYQALVDILFRGVLTERGRQLYQGGDGP